MLEWICDTLKQKNLNSLNFEQWMEHAAYFFCQREHEEGLKYVFEVFDQKKKGWLDKKDFLKASDSCGMGLTEEQVDEIFEKAVSDGKRLKFSEFVFFMKQKPDPTTEKEDFKLEEEFDKFKNTYLE